MWSDWSVCMLFIAFFWGGLWLHCVLQNSHYWFPVWRLAITQLHIVINRSPLLTPRDLLAKQFCVSCAPWLSHYCTPQYIFRRCAILTIILVFVPFYLRTSCPATTFRWYLTESLVINWSFWVAERIIYTLDIPSLGGVDFVILFGPRARLSTDSTNNPFSDLWRVPRPHLLYGWIHTLFLTHSLFEFLF
jgi:hypothetical protein